MILQEPDYRLHLLSKPVEGPQKRSEAMLLHAMPSGAFGLAAPQIGLQERLVLLQGGYFIYNISLEGYGEMEEGIEGCLSIPDRVFSVPRYPRIIWSGYNNRWQKIGGATEGLVARVLQHEADHLDGILISERGEEVEDPDPM